MFADKKIVMVMPERLGDTLMCTPAIHYLKQQFPRIKIDILALSHLAAETLQNNPDIDQIFVLPDQATLQQLQGKYDMGINIHDEPQGREYFNALNIPVKHLPPQNPHMHQAEQALQFVRSLIPHSPPIIDKHYQLFASSHDKNYIDQLLLNAGVDFQKTLLIGCQVGCHSIAKKPFRWWKKQTHPKVWPFEYIIELADKLYKRDKNIRLVITGSNNEKMLGEKLVKKQPQTINLIDKTTVPQLRALMDKLNLFITPDTGLLHVACSSQVPLIALFGPTILQRTGPYPEIPNLTLLQAARMEDIHVDEVYRAVMKQLSKDLN